MFKNYFLTALRNLWRSKLFSLLNVFGLSTGIACCMLIFLYAKDELSYDRFHENGQNIYRVVADLTDSKGEVNKMGNSGLLPGPRFSENVPEIETFVRLQADFCNLKQGNEIFEEEAMWVDENFFSVFSFPILSGNKVSPLDNLKWVVISEDLATKYFGKGSAIGKTLSLKIYKEFEPFVVSAVMKNPPQNSSIKAQMILPLKYYLIKNNDDQWMNFFLNTFVLLKPNANVTLAIEKCNTVFLSEASAQLKEMKEKYDFIEKAEFKLQPLNDMHLSKDYPASNGLKNASNPVYSYILTGIAIFILIIACINFINLTIARSLKRAKEIGIRKVIGGQRKQLVLQFLGESFLLSLVSFGFALLLLILVLPTFNSTADKALSFSYLLDTKLILGYFALFILTGFLAGFYPALVLSRFNPVETLYGKLRFSGKNYLSKSLVILQFTLATFLIIATITIYSQFNYLVNYDLCFDKTNVMRVVAGSMSGSKLETLKNELMKEPSINMISGRQGGGFTTVAHINGNVEMEFGFSKIDEQNFPLFKIPIVKGRNFSKDTPEDSTHSLIVNESFVKAAGWKNPIGEIIDFHYRSKKYNVIGVVKDFHNGPLTEKITPQVFSVDPQLSYQVLFMKINPSGKGAAIKHTEKTIKGMFPTIPYRYSFLDEDIESQYKSEAKWKDIITFAALLTIFISCLGLFGLAALSAEKRAKEIGIRKVLGATVSGIVKKLSTDFIKLVFYAALLAIPLAWWSMNKWLENYPYRIKLNSTVFLIAIASVILIALLSVCYQAVKAAMANPVKNLRTE